MVRLINKVFVFIICFISSVQAKEMSILSPDRKMKVSLIKTSVNDISYNLRYDKDVMLRQSSLGIQFFNESKVIDIYQKGVIKKANYNSYLFKVNTSSINYKIEFRMYNNVVAFRYLFDSEGSIKIKGENSSWALPNNSNVWFFERDSDWKLKTYAGLWQKTSIDNLGEISKQGPIQGKPLIIESNNKYICLTEASLYNYSGLRFEAVGENKVVANFSEGDKGFQIDGKSRTPWRLLYLANDLNELIKLRDVIEDFNPEPDLSLFSNTEYIKPGKSVWSWWSKNTRPEYMDWNHEVGFIDYAARLNFEYVLLDEGWEKWSQKWYKLRRYCELAKQKKVNVWVWKHSDELKDVKSMRLFLDSVKNSGVSGIKIDFFNGESKEIVDFEIILLKESAKRQLMVNFHGCHPPTGEHKTYPNEMTREGIRGIELNIMNQHIPAWHNAALPFTRMLIGHADYTPLAFSNPGKTTWTHQLATAYLFDGKVLVMADDPKYILDNESLKPALSFIKSIPVVWGESTVLPESSIGELVSILKTDNKDYYLIVLNGKDEHIKWEFNSRVLPPGIYDVELIRDAEGETRKFVIDKWRIDKKKNVKKYNLEPNGGMVFKFSKELL